MKIYGYILGLITITLLTYAGPASRVLTVEDWINPVFLVFLRFFWGIIFLLIFLPFVVKLKEFKKVFKKESSILKNKNFWLSSLFFVMTLLCFSWGTYFSSASNVVLIESLSPVIVWIMSFYYFGKSTGSKNYKKMFYVLIFSTVGVSFLLSDNSFLQQWGNKHKLLWDFLAFWVAICFAVFSFFYVELQKDFKKVNGLIITILFLSVWCILTLPTIFIYWSELLSVKASTLASIWLLSAWSTWLAYLLWFLAWRYLSAIMLAMLYNIIWISTVFAEYLYYGEEYHSMTYKLLFWTFMILAAVSYMNYITSKMEKR